MSDGLNINISSYIERSKEKGKNVDFETTAEMLDQIYSHEAFEDKHYSDSVWEFDADAEFNADTFSQLMSEASDGELEKEYVDFLYEFLDVDGDGKLTTDELSVIMGNDKSISGASIRYAMNDYSKKTYESKEHISIDAKDLQDEATVAALESIYGRDSEMMKKLKELSGDEVLLIEKQELSQQQLDDISQQIVDGTAKLSDYEQFLTPESYKALEAARDAKLEEKGATPSDQGSVTPSDQGSVTPSDQGSVTPSDQGSVTPSDQGSVTPSDQGSVTPSDQGSVTPSDQGSVTPSDQGTPDPADPKIAELKKGIENSVLSDPNDDLKSPEDIIQMWIDTGKYAADDPIIAELRASYVTYSDADEAKIATYTDPNGAFGMTREEAIAYLNNEGKLGAPVTSSSTELEDPNAHKSLNQKAIEHHAGEMLEALKGAGSDMDAVMDVLNDPNLTPEDIVDIVTEFKKQSGGISLVEYLDDQWANSDAVQELLADKLYAAAEKGDPDAAKAIADMMKGAMAGKGTADAFLEQMFNKLNGKSDILQAVVDSYSGNLESDIKADHKNWYGWGVNSTGQSYLDIIDKTLNDYYGRN